MSEIKRQIVKSSAREAFEQNTPGLIGFVIRYHREAKTCNCDVHKTEPFLDEERHTADVLVNMGQQDQVLKAVPCMVYSQGIISNGLKPNDRVWVQFTGGDLSLPVITGFYRNPSQWETIVGSFKFAVADAFSEILGLKL